MGGALRGLPFEGIAARRSVRSSSARLRAEKDFADAHVAGKNDLNSICACGRKTLRGVLTFCGAFGAPSGALSFSRAICRREACRGGAISLFLPLRRETASSYSNSILSRKVICDDILAEMGKVRPHDDPGHGRVSCARRGLRHTAAHARLRSRLGACHERVYLRRVDAVCGHRPSDRRRVAPDDGRYHAARERAPSFYGISMLERYRAAGKYAPYLIFLADGRDVFARRRARGSHRRGVLPHLAARPALLGARHGARLACGRVSGL